MSEAMELPQANDFRKRTPDMTSGLFNTRPEVKNPVNQTTGSDNGHAREIPAGAVVTAAARDSRITNRKRQHNIRLSAMS